MKQSTVSGADTYSSAIGEARNYSRWVLDAFSGLIGRRVLEIGIGHGSYVDFLPPFESYLGVDIDVGSVAAAQASRPRYEYLQSDIATPTFLNMLSGKRFDTVLCFNVLEHVENDSEVVANLLKTLQRGGHLLLFVPAFQSLYSPLDRLAGHHRRYRRRELAHLVSPGMGQIVRNEYFNPVGGVGWWVNKFIPYNSLNDSAVNTQVRVFDRYVLPVSRYLNPLTRSIFGQSIVFAVRRS
jgi:SAM-dependent methyltransferase